MSDAAELRKKAALFRRIASIPTSGGSPAERVLLLLADRLDDEAAVAGAARLSDPNLPKPNADRMSGDRVRFDPL